VAKVRDLDVGDRNTDGFAPFSPEDLAVRDILFKPLPDFPPDDFFESLIVTINGAGHGETSCFIGESIHSIFAASKLFGSWTMKVAEGRSTAFPNS
jgi:hypothetical protein